MQEMSDKILCGEVASGGRVMPSRREFMPVPSGGYTIRGQVTTYDNYGVGSTQFQGVATPNRSFASEFASGYNMGLAIGDALERNRARKSYDDCMEKLGWTKVPTGAKSKNIVDSSIDPKTPLGGTCRFTGDCEGTSICQSTRCVARPK